jgi:gluconate 2-dehydrogenase gamma chain
MQDQVTRRAFLAAAGAAGAAWLAADPALVQAALAHARHAVESPPPYQFIAFAAVEAAGLEAIAMRILPSDETPGAREAGVIHFMDKALSTYAAARKGPVLAGLADLETRARSRWPDAASFAALTPARQDELLKLIEQSEFFQEMRDATVVGMFANPSYGGNQNQVGWKLLGFEAHGIYQPPFGYYDAEASKGG